MIQAQPLHGVEYAALGEFADDEIFALELTRAFDGYKVCFFFNDHDRFLDPVGILANVAQDFLVGMDKEAVRADLDRSEIDDGTRGFIYFAFASANHKKSEPRRLARSDAGELCKYINEVFYLAWKHGGVAGIRYTVFGIRKNRNKPPHYTVYELLYTYYQY